MKERVTKNFTIPISLKITLFVFSSTAKFDTFDNFIIFYAQSFHKQQEIVLNRITVYFKIFVDDCFYCFHSSNNNHKQFKIF